MGGVGGSVESDAMGRRTSVSVSGRGSGSGNVCFPHAAQVRLLASSGCLPCPLFPSRSRNAHKVRSWNRRSARDSLRTLAASAYWRLCGPIERRGRPRGLRRGAAGIAPAARQEPGTRFLANPSLVRQAPRPRTCRSGTLGAVDWAAGALTWVAMACWIASTSSTIRMGFPTCPSMPASEHLSTWSAWTFAVSATIRVEPLGSGRALMACVASSPSRTGI